MAFAPGPFVRCAACDATSVTLVSERWEAMTGLFLGEQKGRAR